MRRLTACGVLVFGWAPNAWAAGYDTPILYTARHQAMGGTAIGYVSDPSAAFHNPAGLQHVRGLAVLGDFSLLLGEVGGSPQNASATQSIKSEPVVAPLFLVGAAARLHPWVTVGAALFPVASGGAEYQYTIANPTLDRTQILFVEATPVVSLNVPEGRWLPGKLALGIGYRLSLLSFQREQGSPGNPGLLDLDMTGADFSGVRVGLQYQPREGVSFGLVYRSPLTIVAQSDEGTIFLRDATDAELPFVLAAKLGAGTRFDFGPWGIALDAEYAFQSQNDENSLSGTLEGESASVANIAQWRDGITARLGLEHRFDAGDCEIPARLGYVFDSRVANAAYPSAFGTPPAATHTITAGTGYVAPDWQVNLAVAHRQGSVTVDEDEWLGCRFCGYPGEYSLSMLGVYLDASIEFELE